jgi:DNA-directed RNA polymerase subunit RPC12/RpoP
MTFNDQGQVKVTTYGCEPCDRRIRDHDRHTRYGCPWCGKRLTVLRVTWEESLTIPEGKPITTGGGKKSV